MPPNGNYADRLGDYVEVKDRIKLFYAAHPDGRIVTAEIRVTDDPDGKPRVWAHALAYRTADDPHPGDGWSWLELPGTTPYTRGSEIENAETSAWGRAIGSLGIGIDKAIASANEVQSKAAPEAHQEHATEAAAGPDYDAFFAGQRPPSTAAPRAATGPQPAVGDLCPRHNVPWKGQPGDLYHKSDNGYCRPDGQPKRNRS